MAQGPVIPPCEHENVTRVPALYVEGRPLYKCDGCGAEGVYDDDEPVTCGLTPLRRDEC